MVAMPAFAFTPVASASVGHNKIKNTFAIEVDATTTIPTDGSGGDFGYGTATSNPNQFLVLVTHAGVLDDPAQTSASDPAWHTHVVTVASGNANCNTGDLAVASIDANDTGKVSVSGSAAEVGQIPASWGLTTTKSGGAVIGFDLYVGSASTVCVTNITVLPSS